MTLTVSGPGRFEGDPVKGSRFIVDFAPVDDEARARALLESARAEFPDATHHCWAWRIASPAIERAGDDGEPSGSAGRPILAQLTGRDVVDAAIIVTRYFGGTKLGVGGLVRAYGGAAGEALDAIGCVPWIEFHEFEFEHDYAATDPVERLVNDANGKIITRTFAATVQLRVRLPTDASDQFAASLADLTSGAAIITSEDE